MMLKERADPIPVTGLEHHAGVRMEPPEAAQQPGNDLLGRGSDRRDAKLAPIGIGGGDGSAARFVQKAEYAVNVCRVLLARAGQPQAPAIRAEQLHPERLLHRRERGGHRCLGNHQLLGGRAYRPGLGHGEERAELIQRHSSLPPGLLTVQL